MNLIELNAYAKINLILEIIKKLPSGYHEIRSVFQAVNFHDVVSISKEDDGFLLTGSFICPKEENLVTKIKEGLEYYVKRELPCKINLVKSIPLSAGLGGGSSDAAATLIGLNNLYELGLTKEKLFEIALGVGSDIPYFISNQGTALVEGVGERVSPYKSELSKFYVLIRPHMRIKTSEMYKLHDETKKSFFELAKNICPDISRIYEYFSDVSKQCGMSGSGPTMFAGFDSYDTLTETVNNFF